MINLLVSFTITYFQQCIRLRVSLYQTLILIITAVSVLTVCYLFVSAGIMSAQLCRLVLRLTSRVFTTNVWVQGV